ncbi:MAG TPA: Spy/CpxP family protein refolding chaperone [Nitrospirota bacterium]|nr:Spy/CpxP family protein refolding chaperone [Nitrospirota bacterium]
MRRSVGIIAVAAILIVSGTTVHAQQAPGRGPLPGQFEDDPGFEGPQGREPAPSEAKREAVRKKVEAVRMWRMTEELKLDEKTSTQLASFLSSIEGKRRGLIRAHMNGMKELRAALDAGKPDEGRLKGTIDKIEKNQRAMVDLRQKEIDGIKGMLSTEQQARYLVFQQDFRREIRGMIEGARAGGGQTRGAPRQ